MVIIMNKTLSQLIINSTWPSKVCCKCTDLIHKFTEFRQRVIENQNELVVRFGDPHSNAIFLRHPEIKLEEDCVAMEHESPENHLEYESEESGSDTLLLSAPSTEPDNHHQHNTRSSTKPNTRRDREMVMEMEATISSHMRLSCNLCENVEFETFSSLSAHFRLEHEGEDGHVACCDHRFTERYKLYDHIMNHVDPKGYSCDKCPRTFETQKGLNHHQESHMPDTEKTLTCRHCPKRFFSALRLRTHVANVHDKRQFKCPDCQQEFSRDEKLKEHTKLVHENLRPFICEFCAFAFKSINHLKDHLLTHTDRTRIECPECGKSFINERQLKKHKKRLHSGDSGDSSEAKCKECGYQGKNKYCLAAHINLKHYRDPEEKYKCEICSKELKTAKSLKEHVCVPMHRPYSCSVCHIKFTDGSNKNRHVKNFHPVEYKTMKEARKKNIERVS